MIAVIGRLRQGPPEKDLPAQVLGSFEVANSDIGPLSSPRGLAVDGEGSLYVADLGNNRVVKFSRDGQVANAWGKKGGAAGEFNEPSGVAVDNQGNLFVADAWNGRIQKFSSKCEYLGEISAKAGNFYSPRNIALDSQGLLYVADTGNSCVKKFDSEANLLKRWGEYGNGHDRFRETFGIFVDKDRQVYVGDAGNQRIKIFTADGKYLREIRVKGWQEGVGWPMMAVDSRGTVYAVDGQHHKIWIYDAAGKYLGTWANAVGKEIFASPLGIAVDGSGAVYISNMNRGQILKLAPFEHH
jgi:DNA-binding beta-propeller fold protein YncE